MKIMYKPLGTFALVSIFSKSWNCADVGNQYNRFHKTTRDHRSNNDDCKTCIHVHVRMFCVAFHFHFPCLQASVVGSIVTCRSNVFPGLCSRFFLYIFYKLNYEENFVLQYIMFQWCYM